jgi:2-oxoglutarate-Fe(II)-dependent oxygenase superfamily protein
VFVSHDFMPSDLAERLHSFLSRLPAVAWSVWHGVDPLFRFRHLPAPHRRWCECAVCASRVWLSSTRTCAQLATVLGVESMIAGPLNVTWFADGDFLASHTDAQNGDFAFVWSLTKGWRHDYGGNLYQHGIVQVPAFNRFTLFGVADGRTPHQVSHVSAPAGLRRLSISGWYRVRRP